MAGLAAKFAAAFVVLHLGYLAASGTAPYRFLLETATVRPAAALAGALATQETVSADGAALVSARARMSVREGCEGFEVMLLVAAGVLAAPLAWRRRLAGLAAGLALVYCLNQARIVGLWFALRHDRQLFAALHEVVAPALLVGAACLWFAWFLKRA